MDLSWIGWIVVGLIAGALAKWIMPGKDPGGFFVTMFIGIAGGVVGGFLADFFKVGGGGFLWTILIATGGALLLLFVYRLIKK